MINKTKYIMKKIVVFPIKLYQMLLSPFIGHHCRYFPTCSHYTEDSIQKHGILKGVYLGIRRILSCNPWSKKEFEDPVPERFAWKDMLGYKHSSDQYKEHKK